MKAKTIARFGVLTAAALALGYIEQFIPITGIPGVKLGLSNTVLLYALYMMGARSAALLMVLKVLLSGLLFAGPGAMLYSLAGGCASLAAMLPVKRIFPRVGVVGVSIAGAVFHNIGQILVASFVVLTRAVFAYLPVLLISGVIAGLLTGIAAKYALRALQAYEKRAGGEA